MIMTVKHFLRIHGVWPTHMLVPSENWETWARDAEQRSEPRGDAYARYVLQGSPILRRPIPDSYVNAGGTVAAGAYPGSPPSARPAVANAKLEAFLNAGVTAFIDLTGPADRLAPYAGQIQQLASQRDLYLTHQHFHIPDNYVCDAALMNGILDAIDFAILAGRGVYVHCWGGVGRTGMVIGCWMVRHGKSGAEALEEVQALFQSMTAEKWEKHKHWGSPQTELQRAVVRTWAANDAKRRDVIRRTPGHEELRRNRITAARAAVDAFFARANDAESTNHSGALSVDRDGTTWNGAISVNADQCNADPKIRENRPTRDLT